MEPLLLTLTTDFGTADPYVGVMKGVILGINPRASIIDISHDISPQSILQASFIIGGSHPFFPEGTVHVVVVDPGVGTSRDPLLLVTPRASFVAPDNGVLSHVIRQGFAFNEGMGESGPSPGHTERACPEPAERVALPNEYLAYRLTNAEYWLHPVSSTFHGRDIFAPVAAHLSSGAPPHLLGRQVDQIRCLAVSEPSWDDNSLVGRVAHIDRFGNLISDIPAALLPGDGAMTIEVKGHRIQGLASSYAEGGWLLAVVGSYGTLEVSVKNGNAALALDAKVGDLVSFIAP